MNTNNLPKQPQLAIDRNKSAVDIAAKKLYENAKDKGVFKKEMEQFIRHWGMLQKARSFADAVDMLPQINERPPKKKGAKK